MRGTLRAAALLVCPLLSSALGAQRFQYDYGTAAVTEVTTGIVAIPGGYVMAGTHGDIPMGVVTNPNGGMVLGATQASAPGVVLTPHSLRRTANGSFLVSGEVTGWSGTLQVFLALYSPAGALWPLGGWGPGKYYTYRGDPTGIRQGTRAIETSTGDFAVITNVDPGPLGRGVLFTTGPNGVINCWTAYGYPGAAVRFHDLCQDSDGTFLIVGSLEEPTVIGRKTLVLRTTCGGAPIAAHVYSTPGFGEDVDQQAIALTAGGNFAVWAHYGLGSLVAGSYLFEANGATWLPTWGRLFPTILGSRPTLSRSANGDLLANGRIGNDAFVLRTTAAGVVTLTCTYGAPLTTEEIFQVLPSADGGFVAAGSTQLVDNPTANFYLLRADATGDTTCNWQPVTVPSPSVMPYAQQRQLNYTTDLQMHYVPMLPPVAAAAATQLCFTPGPIVFTGNPVATTAGLPYTYTDSLPIVGNPGFTFDASGLPPFSVALMVLSTALSPVPFPLQLLGGQPDSMLYADPAAMAILTLFADGSGNASLPFPIPANPLFQGAVLHAQVFSFDPALPFALPLGNTAAMSVTIQ